MKNHTLHLSFVLKIKNKFKIVFILLKYKSICKVYQPARSQMKKGAKKKKKKKSIKNSTRIIEATTNTTKSWKIKEIKTFLKQPVLILFYEKTKIFLSQM